MRKANCGMAEKRRIRSVRTSNVERDAEAEEASSGAYDDGFAATTANVIPKPAQETRRFGIFDENPRFQDETWVAAYAGGAGGA